jgi:hypothetical protein
MNMKNKNKVSINIDAVEKAQDEYENTYKDDRLGWLS